MARFGGRLAGEVLQRGYAIAQRVGSIGPDHRRARGFRSFGAGSAICFPVTALYGERYIELGSQTIVGPHSTISCGVSPDHDLGVETALRIGDRCLIGQGSGIVAHESIEIGDDVFTGHSIYITDANHGYDDPDLSIGQQFAEPKAVSIGAGSWIGHGAVVLPGACIGAHVVVGAGSVVTGELPDYCVAVGSPARVVRRYSSDRGWYSVD
jgi:carbonic anhydrase/acetyltransferase-like protein (isoleucine patch superfamily)